MTRRGRYRRVNLSDDWYYAVMASVWRSIIFELVFMPDTQSGRTTMRGDRGPARDVFTANVDGFHHERVA
jgi:hypothetical protein